LLTKHAKDPIPFHRAMLREVDSQAVLGAIQNQQIVGGGKLGHAVEKQLAEWVNAQHVLLTTSCSHALEMSMLIAGIGAGDEVLLPSFAFSSCANAVVLRGATPVFVEVVPDTMTLDPDDLRKRITSRSKVVMPIHYAGVAADMDAIMEIAQAHGLLVVEDAAQGVDARYKGRFLGTIGDMGGYSFHYTKNITCGEGGAFLTPHDHFAAKAEMIREKGTNRAAFMRGEVDKYTWVTAGSSYVPSDLLAALLGSQLAQRDAIRTRRQHIDAQYRDGLADLETAGWLQMGKIPADCQSNYHVFFVLLKDQALWEQVYSAMRQQGVQVSFHYVPLDTAPFGQQVRPAQASALARTADLAGRLLRLPLYPDLSDEEVAYIIEALHWAVKTSA